MQLARKAIEFNPGFSIKHLMHTTPLVKLARIEDAKAAAARILALQSSFRISRRLTSVDCAPTLAAAFDHSTARGRAAGMNKFRFQRRSAAILAAAAS